MIKKMILSSSFIIIGLIGISLLPKGSSQMEAQNKTQSEQAVAHAVAQDKAVAVYFYRPGCPYCVYLTPLVQQLIKANESKEVTFIMVNISNEGPHFKQDYNFNTVPTVIYYKDGKEVGRHGSENRGMTTAKMQQFIDKIG